MPKKRKILLVEDDYYLRKIYSDKLLLHEYDVTVAIDGIEGLEKIEKEKPELILLDLILPRMSGLDMLRKIKKDKKLAKIPVIIVTNSGSPEDIQDCKNLGAVDYIIKAEDSVSTVLVKVEETLKKK